ncbi:MAG: hypothetical protein EPO11_04135 [Gammaproteobacteria bacterium]|nr:MAG: hypothetical protein EPO11_04135 [Gammaproteobacteria bacterium]
MNMTHMLKTMRGARQGASTAVVRGVISAATAAVGTAILNPEKTVDAIHINAIGAMVTGAAEGFAQGFREENNDGGNGNYAKLFFSINLDCSSSFFIAREVINAVVGYAVVKTAKEATNLSLGEEAANVALGATVAAFSVEIALELACRLIALCQRPLPEAEVDPETVPINRRRGP